VWLSSGSELYVITTYVLVTSVPLLAQDFLSVPLSNAEVPIGAAPQHLG
jgi:hypothetical protein